MPQISYGPPGHRGVTRLLAVGDTEYDSPTDQAVTTGIALSGAAWLAGLVLGSSTLKSMGTGAGLALLGVRYLGRKKQVVAVTAPVATT